MALVIAPLTTAVMNAVGSERSGVASGVNNAVSRTGGLLAIAVLNLIVVAVFSRVLTSSLAGMQLSAAVRHSIDGQLAQLVAIVIPPSVTGATRVALQHSIGLAFVQGFRAAMLIAAGLAFVSAIAAAVLIEGKGWREVFLRQRTTRLSPAGAVGSIQHEPTVERTTQPPDPKTLP
jgi:hypothetical protein